MARPSNYPYAYGWMRQAATGAVNNLTITLDALEASEADVPEWIVEFLRRDVAKLAAAEAEAIAHSVEHDAEMEALTI